VTWLMTGVMMVFLAVLLVAGDKLVAALYADAAFAEHGHTIVVLALAALVEAVALGAGQGLRIVERPQVNVRANLLALATTFALACGLVPVLGVLGGAYALLAGNSVATLVRYAAFVQVVKTEAPRQAEGTCR